ncbi:hypothetical protein E8E11_006143 [Didymella keratinophila]|nr:hypothetical protein E8E11_006143 [Didymella keratinophila]
MGRKRWWWKFINSSFTLKRLEGLPSWVPDLHAQEEIGWRRYATDFCIELSREFEASSAPTDFELGSQIDEINLRGNLIDEVRVVYPPMPIWPIYKNATTTEQLDANATALIRLHEWEATLAGAVLSTASDSGAELVNTMTPDMVDTYWRTLVGNYTFEEDLDSEFTEDTWRECREVVRKMAQLWSKWRLKNSMIAAGSLDPNISDREFFAKYTKEEFKYWEDDELWDKFNNPGPFRSFYARQQALDGRQIFQSVHGRLGFVIRGVRPGDLVCVLNGSPTPHVIRKPEDREADERYRLVGDAYVHGLMYGEVEEMGIEARRFVFI